jgi:hypothetical protein
MRCASSVLRAAAAAAAALPLLVALSGCGTFYSETRDKQGSDAKEAWGKVDLASQVAVPRQNHAALLSKQLEVAESLAVGRRDQLARSMVTGGTVKQKLANPTRADLERLAQSADRATQWLAALDDEAFARRSLEKFETEFKRAGLELPSCGAIETAEAAAAIDAWLAAHPTRVEVVRASRSGAIQACKDPRLTKADTVTLGGSEIQLTRTAANRAAADLRAKRAISLNARNEFRAAKAEYDRAAADAAGNAPGATEKVRAAAKKLEGLVGRLADVGDVFGVMFLSKEQKDSLDGLLSTVADTPAGKAPPADSSKAVLALVLIPELVDKAQKALADARKPDLVPFVLAKNLTQIRADAAARDVETQERRVLLLQQKSDRQTERLRALRDANDNLLSVQPSLLDADVAEALAPVRETPASTDAAGKRRLEDKIRLWKAAAFYLHAQAQLRAEVEKVDYQVNALEHERVLAYAESNIAQWNTLISSSVDQMAEFGASGIKKEDIVALINSLTLLWIGKGVN